MNKKALHILILFLATAHVAKSQQYQGLSTNDYAGIQNVPYNPAWVTYAQNGTEINIASASILVGTNAFNARKGWIFSNGLAIKGIEGEDYYKDQRSNTKHIWGNMDILGPAISFTYQKEHNIGIYTRARQIIRGGGIGGDALRIFGNASDRTLFVTPDLKIKKAGFSSHSFSEVGFSYARRLQKDDYHILNLGVTLKYLMGVSAGSIYINSLDYNLDLQDTTLSLNGDITLLYSYNIANYVEGKVNNSTATFFNRAGRGSLGFDIGAQYEYHPDGNPNYETPYLFSIAASITDIGSISYFTDTGSAKYNLNVNDRVLEEYAQERGTESTGNYFNRLVTDSLLTGQKSIQKFKVGLPTAFRLNIDWNTHPRFNLNANLLLNLRGNNGSFYKSSYISYFNFTPTYGTKLFKVSVPFTYYGYQTMTIGLILRSGPFYLGSSSLLSSMLVKRTNNIDFYTGVMLKLRKDNYKH